MSPQNRQRPLRSVSIVGPGRLGQAMAIALSRSGYSIKALVARRPKKAEKFADSLVSGRDKIRVLSLAELPTLEATDLILITTPDDAIEGVVQKLTTSLERVNGRIVLHTSGALSSEVLSSLVGIGFHTGSLHPLVSVSEPVVGAKALRGAFFCVEGDAPATRLARRIVADLGGTSFTVAASYKPLYHAAALTAAGHMTALIHVAIEMLVSSGLKRKQAQQVLMPLVESAVKNLNSSTPAQALTGTFARGDLATVQQHLAALSGTSQAEALEVYKLLGLHSLRLAEKKIDRKVAQQIRRLLK